MRLYSYTAAGFQVQVFLTPESHLFCFMRLFSEMCVCVCVFGKVGAGNSLGLEGGKKSGDWRVLGRGPWDP